MIVKVGNEGKYMTVIPGFFVVEYGLCKRGDYFANVRTYEWERVTEEEIGDPAETFECLIREKSTTALWPEGAT